MFCHEEMTLNEIIGDHAICYNCQIVIAEKSPQKAAKNVMAKRNREKQEYAKKMKEKLESIRTETNIISKDFIASNVLNNIIGYFFNFFI